MDIGQALAMMRDANQIQDYRNQLSRQPNLDWRDIAQASEYDSSQSMQPPMSNTLPERDRQNPFSYGDVVSGYAPELPPPTPAGMPMPPVEGYAPMDTSFLELYGMPATPKQGETFSYNPMTPSGVMGGYPTTTEAPPAQVYQMPPLPVPGMASAELPSQVSTRPDIGMTDVPMQQPMGYTKPLAMLGETDKTGTESQVQAEEAAPTPVANTIPEAGTTQETQAATKPFKPGEDFKVNLTFGDKQYEAVVQGYVPPRAGERAAKAVSVTIPALNNKSMLLPATSEQYQSIVDEYERIKPLEVIGEEYPSLVRVEGITDPKTGQAAWLPAKIDAASNQILYKDPDTGVGAVYNDKRISDITEEDFLGPLDQRGIRDNTQLVQLQQRRLQPLNQSIQRINAVSTGFRGNDPEYIIRNNLRGNLGPGTMDNPLGEISWNYVTQDGTQMTLEDASKAGYLPQGFEQEIQSAYDDFKNMALEQAKSALAAQTAAPLSQTQRDIQIINDNIKINQDRIDSIKKDQKYSESAKGKAEIKSIQKVIDDLNAKLTSVTKNVSAQTIAGGSTVFQAVPDVTAYNIDPTTQAGLLSILAGAAPLPSESGAGMQTVEPWSPDQLVTRVMENALSKSNPYTVSDDKEYTDAMSALSQRLENIQSAAAEYAARDSNVDPEDVINSTNAIFRYVPIKGGPLVTETMSVSQAVKDLEESAADFREKAASGDTAAANEAKERFANSAQRFTGMLVVPGIGPFSASALESRGFNNLTRRFQPAPVSDYPIARAVQITPGMRVAEAPKTTVVPPRSGGGGTVVQKGVVYPLWYTPGSNFGKSGYEKADETYNIFERLGHNEQTYIAGGKSYSENAIQATTLSSLARIFGDDSGSVLDQDAVNSVNTTVTKFNQDIIKDPKLRANYATMLWDITKASGYPPAISAAELAQRLELVYTVAKNNPGEINKALNWVVAGVRGEGVDGRNAQKAREAQNYNIGKAEVGSQVVEILNAAKSGQKPEFAEYAGKIPGNTTRLADNVEQQWYELALLYAAAANGKTMYSSGMGTVTWMYNPADTNNRYMRSALTIPASKTGYLDKQLPAANASNGKDVKGVSNHVGAEPVYSAFIMRANQVLGGANINAFRNEFKKNMDPIVDVAKKKFAGRGSDLASTSTYRPDDDKNVNWTNSSANVVSKLSTDVILLGNVLGRNRDRTNVYRNSWPGYDPARAR